MEKQVISSSNIDFSALSLPERILLAERLWDSIAEDAEAEKALPLTEEQKRELDNRLAAEEAGKLETFSWEEVKQWLLQPGK